MGLALGITKLAQFSLQAGVGGGIKPRSGGPTGSFRSAPGGTAPWRASSQHSVGPGGTTPCSVYRSVKYLGQP